MATLVLDKVPDEQLKPGGAVGGRVIDDIAPRGTVLHGGRDERPGFVHPLVNRQLCPPEPREGSHEANDQTQAHRRAAGRGRSHSPAARGEPDPPTAGRRRQSAEFRGYCAKDKASGTVLILFGAYNGS